MVNAKGYSSKTEYLVLVSIAYQRVNVFTGSAGNWNLVKTFIVGTGAPGHSTPTGVFTIIGKRSAGWTTSTYTVKPLINFLTTRSLHPGCIIRGRHRQGRSGSVPVSHGCIRM
jgi:lipoprotein-anchoring transpeptidase ErfK/SrfK